jgi:hypothetical protein
MMDTIALGREAWQRIKKNERATWTDWLAIGYAMQAGRNAAMKIAGCNRPLGRKYTAVIRHWLETSGFADLDNQERWKSIFVVEHLAAIEKWRATLPETTRLHLNHPCAVMSHFKRATGCKQRQNHKNGISPSVRPSAVALPAQDRIRVVYDALRATRSGDLMILALAATKALDAFNAGQQPPADPAQPRPANHAAEQHAAA